MFTNLSAPSNPATRPPLDQDDYAGNAGDVLKHAVWGHLLDGASRTTAALGVLETHCGLPERTVRLDARRMHFTCTLPDADFSSTSLYAAALRQVISLSTERVHVPGSPLLSAMALRARLHAGSPSFGVFVDADSAAIEALLAHPWFARAELRAQLTVGDAFSREHIAELPQWVRERSATDAPRTLIALVDPFRYAPAGSNLPEDLLSETLHATALERWTEALVDASGLPSNVVVAAWIYEHGEAACEDVTRAFRKHNLEPSSVLARIEADGCDYARYAMVVVGAGEEGRALAEGTFAAPWNASPTLNALGFRIVAERR